VNDGLLHAAAFDRQTEQHSGGVGYRVIGQLEEMTQI
jgi:hypothetical protein